MINLIMVLTIWWCPCVQSSLVLLEEGVCYDQCVLLAKLLAFALLRLVPQSQPCLLLQISLDFLLLHSSPLWCKGHLFFFGVSSRRSCRFSQNCSTSASLALVVGAQTWISVTWMVCLGNEQRSFCCSCHAVLQGIFPTQGSNPGLRILGWLFPL